MHCVHPLGSCSRRRNGIQSATLWITISVVVHNLRSGSASAANPSTSMTLMPLSESSTRPFSSEHIAKFIGNRCGSNQVQELKDVHSPLKITALWAYEGTLTDPMTGKVVAEVEGLELLRPVSMLENPSSPDNQRSTVDLIDAKTSVDDLCAKDLLLPSSRLTKTPPQWDSAMTILSRKLFCYRRPSSSKGKSTTKKNNLSPSKFLLNSIRLRPDGPLRHLSPLESMSIYDSAVTYISRNQGREMVVFSERGGGDITENGVVTLKNEGFGDYKKHYVMGSARGNGFGKRQSTSAFDFAIHARKGSAVYRDGVCNGGPMLPPLKFSSNNDETVDGEVVISPPRMRFLQFGKSGLSNGEGGTSERKFGSAHETYSYSFRDIDSETDRLSKETEKKVGFSAKRRKRIIASEATSSHSLNNDLHQQCTVHYTRYGEAPPWYAPGRMCTLELRGKRIETAEYGELDGVDDSLCNKLPRLALWASTKFTPSFWSGWPVVDSAIDAIQAFSEESQRFFHHLDDEQSQFQRNALVSFVDTTYTRVQSTVNRLSKSFIHTQIPRQ
mmetsp:Transcript_9964/g.21412  ORF Transcript_9964/g.21412 Transcript_9964/m.21412 type:complete len:556 (+) Transcript_9964:61-1728(+)